MQDTLDSFYGLLYNISKIIKLAFEVEIVVSITGNYLN